MATQAMEQNQQVFEQDGQIGVPGVAQDSGLLDRILAMHTGDTIALERPEDIARAMRQFDGDAFLAQVEGQALEKWFYSFKIGGKLMEGVSAEGAHEFARLRAEQGYPIRFPMHNIRLEEATENGEQGMRAMIVAMDHRTKQEAIGMAFYPYYEERKVEREDRSIDTVRVYDRFAGRKAISVAQRNAILDLVPTRLIVSALKSRAQIIAANEKQIELERQERVANRQPAKQVSAGEARSEQQRDPYEGQPQPTGDSPACPKCGGEMWDNRAKKANGEFKATAPDFGCKNKHCGGKIWPPKDGEQSGMKF